MDIVVYILTHNRPDTFIKALKSVECQNYKDFKIEVADAICKFVEDVQSKFYEYRNDESRLKEILKGGANKAKLKASAKMNIVKERIGLKI